MATKSRKAATTPSKAPYHHGDLRQTLVDATRRLVVERGAENFTLSDACRIAGVSTAAPYKHFTDKDEILREIVVQGFKQFSAERAACIARHPQGSLASMIAMGQGYVAFARSQPAIFRLMFGQNRNLAIDPQVSACGQSCFQGVVADVAVYCAANGLQHNSAQLALELWTFVHGAASLVIDEAYDKVSPGLDVDAIIAAVAPRILATGDHV